MEYYKDLSLNDLIYTNSQGLICCEEWRNATSYEGIYKVSDLGRVKSLKMNKQRILKQSISGKTYLSVGLSKKGIVTQFLPQVLVAIAFLGHVPCGHLRVVDHIDNNPLNNCLSNIQIITARENSSKDRKSKLGEIGIRKTKKGKFVAIINIEKKSYNLGIFNSMKEASEARKMALMLYSAGDDFRKVKVTQPILLHKGVYPKRDKFYARITVNGKCINLGSFANKEDAYLAREKALIENNIKYA